MKPGEIMNHFTIKDGTEVILRIIQEDELENLRQLYMQIFKEDINLNTLMEKHQRYPSLFIGCFHRDEIIGIVFGWPDPEILVVKAIAVLESYRRKGIGTALLRSFENAAMGEGFDNFVLGAAWEAVPFYIHYGLKCFANVQIKPDEIPWNKLQRLRSKYDVIAAVVFGTSTMFELIPKLCQELNVKVGLVNTSFNSISIQIRPEKISKEVLEEMKRDFNAYSTQFAFKKKFS